MLEQTKGEKILEIQIFFQTEIFVFNKLVLQVTNCQSSLEKEL